MDTTPVAGIDELDAHLDQLVDAPETVLNIKLFDDVELQLTGTCNILRPIGMICLTILFMKRIPFCPDFTKSLIVVLFKRNSTPVITIGDSSVGGIVCRTDRGPVSYRDVYLSNETQILGCYRQSKSDRNIAAGRVSSSNSLGKC